MVFGRDLLENVRLLAGLVNNIEIVLFYTPSLHNIPDQKEINMLKKIGEGENIRYTVHLPASFEIASGDEKKREESVRLIREICLKTAEIDPEYYILHIPYTPPTLVAVPGLYFTSGEGQNWNEWTNRALESLEMLTDVTGDPDRLPGRLLVENINYSPCFLEPFWEKGFCKLCLDLGHLMLGRENVIEMIKEYLSVTREIHLHGVKGDHEHISLSVLPENLVSEWLKYLKEASFEGIINLEVFDPHDLKESMEVMQNAL